MTVFDASALLAYLQGEAGADAVRASLESGGACSAANWSEVAQKVRSSSASWELARGLLLSYPLTIESVTLDDAELAATLWKAGQGLSLGDRICLALGRRLGAEVLTTDVARQSYPHVRLVR